MANGQRRRIIGPGFGASLLGTLTEKVSRDIEKKRAGEEAIKQIFATALAEKRAEEQFPDIEERAKQFAFGEIQRQSQDQPPQLAISPQASPEQQQLLQRRLSEAQANREQRLGPGQRMLDALQSHGFLGSGGGGQGVNVFAFDPAQGKVAPAVGGANLPPGSRVLSTRVTPEEAGKVTGARATATAKAKERVEFAGVAATMNTAINLLDKIPPPSGQVSGFTTSQLRKGITKLGFEPELNEFITFANSVKGQLAKTVSREGGRLTDQDIGRVAEVLDQLPFLPIEGRFRRMKTLNSIIMAKGFPPLFDDPRALPDNVDVDSARQQFRQSQEPSMVFNSVEEAEAADLPPGTIISIGGRRARID